MPLTPGTGKKIIMMSFCPMRAAMASPALPSRGISTLIWPTILSVWLRSLAWRRQYWQGIPWAG